MLLTMAAVAAAKGIVMPDMEVHASAEMRNAPGRPADTLIRSVITYRGALTRRERTILFNAARNCEVHKLLRGHIAFEERLDSPGSP